MHKRALVLSLVGAFLVAVAACGGGSQGDSCDSEGSTEGCDDRLVCGRHTSSGELTCLQSCVDDGDCLSTDKCSGLKGSAHGCTLR